uniref:Uncharacterized protein n=1 Tax=Siphoviridae sp. ctwQT14 TaxID=2827971 RepID=A0A8S5TJT5_9CAUD|nr:MAG TPA: hypothetical protein [Siphoviridae sp. ctwQT14]
MFSKRYLVNIKSRAQALVSFPLIVKEYYGFFKSDLTFN